MPHPHVTIRGLTKRFGDHYVYDGFDLDLPRGELVSIFGPNGCGKSTLINMIAGLVPTDAGKVLFDGKPIRDISFGYVFQNYREALFPWLAAFDNIAYPLRFKNISPRERRERVGRMLLMHANHREDIKEAYAGDIIALAGLKEARTGDTLCDMQKPVMTAVDKTFTWGQVGVGSFDDTGNWREVKDWAEIQRACEWLARNGVHLVWGPGRHIIGHNIAIYHSNADKVRVEFFCEMDLMKDEALGYFDPRPWHQDRPQRPKVWGPDTLRNYWGFGSERVIRGYQTIE